MAYTREQMEGMLNTGLGSWQEVTSDSFKIALHPAAQMKKSQLVFPQIAILTMAQLGTEAGTASLDHLANLWRARWGDQWVRQETITRDEFFTIAAERLMQGGYLEAHETSEQIRVYRMKK